jgi:phospholipid/cholesterol/gamma-HCH transport system substrate-binding protein
VGGLHPGAPVEIAGVPVGQVERVRLDRHDYADVTLRIAKGVVLQDDATVAIRSNGLIGEEHVSIAPGTSPQIVKDGGRLRKTEDAVNLGDAITQLILGKV